MKLVTAIALLLLLAPADNKQSYLQDYQKITAAYSEKSALSFSVQYKSFDTSTSKPDTVITAQFKMKKDKFYCKLGTSETYKNDKYYLAVDHTHKIMLLNKASSVGMNFAPGAMLDSFLLKVNPAITKTELNNGKARCYTLQLNSNELYKAMAIEFDLNTYLISRIKFTLNEYEDEYEDHSVQYLKEPFAEMVYSNYNTADVADAVFSIDKYVYIKSATDVILKGAYKNYTLMNSIALTHKNR